MREKTTTDLVLVEFLSLGQCLDDCWHDTLCVGVKINKRLFEPFCVWDLFQNASSHSVPDYYVLSVPPKHSSIFQVFKLFPCFARSSKDGLLSFQGELEYEIQPNDKIVFISTLHGG